MQLGSGDLARFQELMALFGEAFDDPENCTAKPPDDDYVERLLGNSQFVAFVAIADGLVVGGLAGYLLPKFEQQRSEFYIYDLAIAAVHQHPGIATAFIETSRQIAAKRGAWVVFVQADRSDDPAIALYSKLGERQDALHFDIPVRR